MWEEDRPPIRAADIATGLRELFEDLIPPHRRAPDWGRKWQRVEDFANDADEN